MKKIDFRNKKQTLTLFAVIFAVIGAILLVRSFAATVFSSVETEGTTVSGAATIGSDSTASGGKYVQFGGSTSGHVNVTLPTRATFYYPWFPETWTVGGVHVFYHPDLGYYDSSTQSVVDKHIQAMDYGKFKISIASWWGQGQHSESTRIPLLLNRTQALGSNLKWAMYYEKEGSADPSVSEIQADLNYIKNTYATSSSYAYVNNKPVVFVYSADANDQANICATASRWAQANATAGFYVDLKLQNNFATCSSQPDSWHQYGGAAATDSHTGYHYSISPGYWQANEATPRLARDPARFTSNVQSMVASNAPWQLVTTFNEWGEGTAIESATEWSSASGYGIYQDILHNN